MARLSLILVLHNHQPIGNLPHVFRDATNSAYLPLIGLLERHPRIRCALHYTGPLLEWLEANEPEALSRLATLQARGQVEVLGGALYEPILAVIPDADKVGQLRAMSDRVEALFGARPAGAWLAERVWEPHLPRYLSAAGLSYTILDQEHFEKAGLAPGEVDGAWLTEDVGNTVTLLPASTDLRYLIPWRSVEEVIGYLRRQHAAGRQLLVFGDDGEKFGVWPGTYRLCYEEGWLERFLQALEENEAWLETTLPAQWLAGAPERRRVYIPSASYPEMEDWSLSPGTQHQIREARRRAQEAGIETRFLRLGHWRGFLSRYAEANLMLQRAIGISSRAHALPDGPRKQAALDHLWRGQCNCPYWHGVFGGIYLYHIRHAAFSELVAADALADALAPDQVVVRAADYDADGKVEWCLSSPEQAVFVHPTGAHLFEWDLRTEPINLLNTLAPYREAYAAEGAAEQSGTVPLRRAFQDHLLSGPLSLEQVLAEGWPEAALPRPVVFHLEGIVEGSRGQIRALGTWPAGAGDGAAEVALEKVYAIRAGERELTVTYTGSGLPARAGAREMAVELSLALPPGADSLGELSTSAARHRLTEPVDLGELRELRCSAGYERLLVDVNLEPAARVFAHPLHSQHRTEQGEERVYQGTRIVVVWGLPADEDATWRGQVTLSWGH